MNVPDRSAFSESFARLDAHYRGPLVRFFLRRLDSAAEAEDLTQEVFLKLVRHSEVRPLVEAEPYIFKVALNVLRDRQRRYKVRNGAANMALPAESFEEGLEAPIPPGLIEEIAPERVLLGREALLAVVAALAELSDTTRDVFVLHRLEKVKQSDIAAMFNLSVSAIEKHIVRAAVHLAKRLPNT